MATRREFLRTGALLAAAAAGACSGGSGGNPDIVLVANDWDFFAGSPNRLSILIASGKNNGAPLALDSKVLLRVGPQNGPLGAPIAMTVHADGPEPQYASTTYEFPRPGVYQLAATFKGKTATLPISVTDPKSSTAPTAGNRLPSIPTPTSAAPLGVNPVCTAQPACPFHSVSLDAALKIGKPIALLFATPALCQSRFCGPVLANLQAVAGPWMQEATIIHNEIYTDLTGSTTTAAVNAFKLEHEPLLYLAGSDGIIKLRMDNLFDKGDAKAALAQVFGPASCSAQGGCRRG